jgi:hypothetical protein
MGWNISETNWEDCHAGIYEPEANSYIAVVLNGPEADERARLIAAAPDLLEALEAVIDDLKSGIQDGIDNGAVEAWLVGADARLKAARAAIRKARGEG